MKNYCVVHILLFLLFMLVYQCARAQDYLVTVKGDTIRGDIKTLSFGIEKKAQVTGPDRRKSLYTVLQTRVFVSRGDTFVPVRLPEGYVFMKQISKGYLSLLAFQGENQNTFDSQYLLKKDGSGMELPNLTFKKVMARFLEDCPGISTRIEQGDLGKRDLDKIIQEYNACIDVKTVDHQALVQKQVEAVKKLSAWDVLDEKLKAASDFEGKTTSLEMVTEIKNKISRTEKVPNFIIQGLKDAMAKSGLQTELDNALKELNN